jgi:hypothetical protein
VRSSERFRSAFASAYEQVAAGGPMAALGAVLASDRAGGPP